MRSHALALFAAAALGALPLGAQQPFTRSAPLDADGEFRIWNLHGSVRVVGWDVDSVRVDGTADAAALADFSFASRGRGGKMSMTSHGAGGRADLVVRLPRGATVWVKTMSAPVQVDSMRGVIDVYAVTGGVRIHAPSARSVYAESMGGRVRVTGRAGVVRLRSASGRIEFEGAASDLSLTSVDGDVLARADALHRAVVETVGGRVHLGLAPVAGAQVEILTHDGAVDLALPARASGRFALRSVSGRIEVRPQRADALGRGAVAFTTGRGAADVEVRTFSGDVVVRFVP